VRSWVNDQTPSSVYTTAITVAEILYGIERLPDGKRKQGFTVAATELFTVFSDRVLPFDDRASRVYASVTSQSEKLGIPIDGFDAQIAAICNVHNAVLATRNTKDFEHLSVPLVNPWN
jgi:toxin FitB